VKIKDKVARIGRDMCYWVLQQNGKVISCTNIQHVTKKEAAEEAIKAWMMVFNSSIKETLEEGATSQPLKGVPNVHYLEDVYETDEKGEGEGSVHEEPTPDSFNSPHWCKGSSLNCR
jgi:hypothetical protein